MTNYRLRGKSPFEAKWFTKNENGPESRGRRPVLVGAVIANPIAVFVLKERRK